MKPISSNWPRPLFRNRKLAAVSLETNKSSQPSLLMSVATTPCDLPGLRPMAVRWPTSVNVPSPLLRNSRLGRGLKNAGNAVIMLAQLVVAAENILFQAVFDETADE